MIASDGLTTRRRAAAVGLVAGLTVAAAGGAVLLLSRSIGAVRADVAGSGASASTTFLHLLVAALGAASAWLTAIGLAAITQLRTIARPADLPRAGAPGRHLHHRLAAIALVLTGAGALGSTSSAVAAPLPPPVVQAAAAPAAPRPGAMALPLPTDDAPETVPRPGWVTPAPSPLAQRCRPGARLIAGLVTREHPTEVVVHRGDSLWSLVSRHLHTSDPCVISAVWPQWYAANRAVIGDDPDLLLVGQRLRIPPLHDTVTPQHTTQGER